MSINQAAPAPGGIRALLGDVINRAGGWRGILAQVAVAAGTAHLQNAAMEATDGIRELRADADRIAAERRRELAQWEQDNEHRITWVRNAAAAGVLDDIALDRVADIERQLRYGDDPVYAARIIAGYRHGLDAMDAPAAKPDRDDPVDAVVVDQLGDDDAAPAALAVVRE